MEFKNKVVLITGASKGIGAETARLFAKEGAIVVINYKKSEDLASSVLEDIKKTSDGIIVKADITEEKEVKNMIDKVISKYSRIDILVNNAGGYIDGDEWDGSVKTWKTSIDLNLTSALIVSKYVAREFLKQQSGTIVNVASRYAYMGHWDSITYAASKAAIVNITQSYSKLLSPFGRANSVSPGATDAGIWKTVTQQELKDIKSKSPHKRLISTKEIANTIVFLASSKAEMITGQDILVDGGK